MSDGKFRPLDPTGQDCPTEFLLFNFNIGSPTLKPAHERFLKRGILTILEANEDHKVRLVGRASRSGRDSLDLKLSRQRAEAVAALLTRAGIDRSRIQVDFIGKSNPFSTANESEEDRSVEIHLQISPTLTIELEDGGLGRRADVILRTIRDAFAPLPAQAGRKPQIHLGGGIATGGGGRESCFDRAGRGAGPLPRMTILPDQTGSQI